MDTGFLSFNHLTLPSYLPSKTSVLTGLGDTLGLCGGSPRRANEKQQKSQKLFKEGEFKFEVQQLMMVWCSLSPPRIVLHVY